MRHTSIVLLDDHMIIFTVKIDRKIPLLIKKKKLETNLFLTTSYRVVFNQLISHVNRASIFFFPFKFLVMVNVSISSGGLIEGRVMYGDTSCHWNYYC
jgi:hypothetical protein